MYKTKNQTQKLVKYNKCYSSSLMEVWEPVHLNIINDRPALADAEAQLWLIETWQLSRHRFIAKCKCRDRIHMLELRKDSSKHISTHVQHADKWLRIHITLWRPPPGNYHSAADCECTIHKHGKHCNEIPLHTFQFHAMPLDLFAAAAFHISSQVRLLQCAAIQFPINKVIYSPLSSGLKN